MDGELQVFLYKLLLKEFVDNPEKVGEFCHNIDPGHGTYAGVAQGLAGDMPPDGPEKNHLYKFMLDTSRLAIIPDGLILIENWKDFCEFVYFSTASGKEWLQSEGRKYQPKISGN